MKKTVIICDHCKKEADPANYRRGAYGISDPSVSPEPTFQNYEFCEACAEELAALFGRFVK